MRFALAIIALLLTAPAHADLTADHRVSDEWGSPEVALLIHSPFSIRQLEFVLYASGRVLFIDSTHRQPPSYLEVTLTSDEKKSLLADLPLERVGSLNPPHRIGDDGATFCIEVWKGDTRKADCIWGWIDRDGDRQNGGSPTPPAMTMIWERLTSFASTVRAKPYVPPQVTARVMPWHCGQATKWWSWPKKWPRRGKPGTTIQGDGWSFVVDGSALSELRRLSSGALANGCVQPIALDGGYVYLSPYYPLPHQDAWWR